MTECIFFIRLSEYIDSYSKIVCRSFLLPNERRYIEGVDRMMVNIDLTSVDYRVISV